MDERQKKSAQYWLESSEDDWNVANHLFEKGDYSHSLFFGHLTIEKIRNGAILILRWFHLILQVTDLKIAGELYRSEER